MARAGKTPDFEQSLNELERIVERLEEGELPLDEALKTFERGIELTRQCQSALRTAQQKVEVLLERNGDAVLEPFETGGAGADDLAAPGDDAEE